MKKIEWLLSLGIMSLLFFNFAAAADPAIEVDPHHTGLVSSLNLGIRYSSFIENRGVLLYKDFQIDPVLGIFLFDDRLEYLGDSIGYRDFLIKNWLRGRSRFVAISDAPLFPNQGSIRATSVQRSDTYEWSNSLEFFVPAYDNDYISEFDLTWAKDISIHHGNYLELQNKLKLIRFRLPWVRTLIEPNLYTSLGWGDTALNQYFYGPSASSSGFNNDAVGVWFAFPEEADRYYPIIIVKYFQTLSPYQNAEYATGNNQGWLFSFIATYGLLN